MKTAIRKVGIGLAVLAAIRLLKKRARGSRRNMLWTAAGAAVFVF